MQQTFLIKTRVWKYSGKAAWFFATIPTNITEEINDLFAHVKRGWGSLPVQATIGNTTWKTSIFPDTKTHTYLLPIKSVVRKKESIDEHNEVSIYLQLSD